MLTSSTVVAVDYSHTASIWLELIILGGLLGAIGQTIRMAIGLKKTADRAEAADLKDADLFVASKAITSFIYGFAVGALAMALAGLDPAKIFLKEALAIIAAGYAGADLIEGLVERSGIAKLAQNTQQNVQVGEQASAKKTGAVTQPPGSTGAATAQTDEELG